MAAGIIKLLNKTPLLKQGRNEESCEQSRGVVGVPVVIEPVVVPVPPIAVPVEVTNIEVAIRVAVAYKVPPE